jgi:predicted metal-dependent hydrolase
VTSNEHHDILLGGTRYTYVLSRSSRRTLAITVEPGGSLRLTAPAGATTAQIEAAMRRRGTWIRRRVRETSALPPPAPAREWVNGETHRYLGRQYRLRISSGSPTTVRLAGRWFQVTVESPSEAAQVERAMRTWFRERARAVTARRMEALIQATPLLRISEPPSLAVRRMTKRWGSCSVEGRILMNVDAVKLPVGCIDYVLMHELCHVRVPNHGPKFWRLLDACMPDWEHWRARLNAVEI